MRWTYLISIVLVGCAGCEPDPPAAVTPSTQSSGAQRVPGVRVERVATVPAGRLMHVAADGAGHLFWAAESERAEAESARPGEQVIFAMGDGGVPAATRMSNAGALAALVGKGGAAGAGGQIQSLAFGADGRLYFYFVGGTRREVIAGVGSFLPGSDEVRVLADTAGLKAATNMGDSIGLARGTLVRSGDLIWVWVRHPDGWAVMTVDTRRPGATLRRQLDGSTTDVRMTSEREDLTAGGAGGGVTYLDRAAGAVWRISPLGQVTAGETLADLPAGMAAPVADDQGHLVTVTPGGRAFGEKSETDEISAMLAKPVQAGPALQYPALILIDGARRTSVGRDRWQIGAGLSLGDWAPPQLVIDRGAIVAYDPAAGALVRVKLE